MLRMPAEVDNAAEIRAALIERRDKALGDADFNTAVLLSHTIAWMGYLVELLNERKAGAQEFFTEGKKRKE